jgi:hypothetical protein
LYRQYCRYLELNFDALNNQLESDMAENGGGGIGILGVLIGALIVIVVGGGVLFATGKIGGGSQTSTIKLELPKAAAPASK